jgi:hypothetical protein
MVCRYINNYIYIHYINDAIAGAKFYFIAPPAPVPREILPGQGEMGSEMGFSESEGLQNLTVDHIFARLHCRFGISYIFWQNHQKKFLEMINVTCVDQGYPWTGPWRTEIGKTITKNQTFKAGATSVCFNEVPKYLNWPISSSQKSLDLWAPKRISALCLRVLKYHVRIFSESIWLLAIAGSHNPDQPNYA